jgi:hypothetical protein
MIGIGAGMLEHVRQAGGVSAASLTFRVSEQLLFFFGLTLQAIGAGYPGMAEEKAPLMPTELELQYIQYKALEEEQYLPAIRQLISKDLSEPYSIYVYRYFLYQWGDLCYMVLSSSFHSCSRANPTFH